MIRFLAEFIRNIGQSITLIVMDKAQMEQPRTYNLEPKRVLIFAGLSVFILFLLLFSLLDQQLRLGLHQILSCKYVREYQSFLKQR